MPNWRNRRIAAPTVTPPFDEIGHGTRDEAGHELTCFASAYQTLQIARSLFCAELALVHDSAKESINNGTGTRELSVLPILIAARGFNG